MPRRSHVPAIVGIMGQSCGDSFNTYKKGLIDAVRMCANHLGDGVTGNDEAGIDLFRTGAGSTEDDISCVTESVDNSLEAECAFCPDDHTGIPLFDG